MWVQGISYISDIRLATFSHNKTFMYKIISNSSGISCEKATTMCHASTDNSNAAEASRTEVDHYRLLFLAGFTRRQAQNMFKGSITCHLLNLSNWK